MDLQIESLIIEGSSTGLLEVVFRGLTSNKLPTCWKLPVTIYNYRKYPKELQNRSFLRTLLKSNMMLFFSLRYIYFVPIHLFDCTLKVLKGKNGSNSVVCSFHFRNAYVYRWLFMSHTKSRIKEQSLTCRFI